MNRLQKKCFIASTGLHLTLSLVLLVGPAFLSPKSQQQNVPLIDFVPAKLIESSLAGGGNPNAESVAASSSQAGSPSARYLPLQRFTNQKNLLKSKRISSLSPCWIPDRKNQNHKSASSPSIAVPDRQATRSLSRTRNQTTRDVKSRSNSDKQLQDCETI